MSALAILVIVVQMASLTEIQILVLFTVQYAPEAVMSVLHPPRLVSLLNAVIALMAGQPIKMQQHASNVHLNAMDVKILQTTV